MATVITKEIAQKVVDTVRPGLCSGLGTPIPGQMCVEAAVCYALGAPHSDNHECIGYAVRAFKIALNDKSWSSNAARAKGLQRVAVAQLGSNEIDQVKFVTLLAERIVTLIPASAAYAAAYAAKSAAASAAYAAAYAAKSAAAYAAAYAAKSAAKYAAEYAAYAAEYAKYDQVLSEAAEIAVQILIELKSPGTLYLSLCD